MKLPTKHTTDDEDWFFCSVVTNYKFNHHTFITLNRAVLNVEKQSPFYKLAEVQLRPSVNETCTPAWESFPRLQISICITNLCSVKHSLFFYYPYFPTTSSLICSTISFLLTSYRSVGQRVCDQQMNRGCHNTAYDKIRKVLKMRCVFTLKKDRKAKPKSPQQFTYFTFICRSKLSLYQQFNISYRCIGMTFPSCCSVWGHLLLWYVVKGWFPPPPFCQTGSPEFL